MICLKSRGLTSTGLSLLEMTAKKGIFLYLMLSYEAACFEWGFSFFSGQEKLPIVAVPLYLSEMAPTHLRGSQNLMFHLATAMGIFTANMINYGIGNLPSWGWRLSLGLAALPAIIMTVGGLLLPETPNSLIERGSRVKGRQVLERIRGTKEVDAEFENIVDASELANSIKHP
ncbi:hypothetical protein AAG906_011293 [Vitis piasezkii]